MDQKIQVALESQNPWWFDQPFDTGVGRLSHVPEILQYLDCREILLLAGARRTGKSTLVYQIIRTLLERDVPKEAILYLNLDEPLFSTRKDDPAFLSELIEDYCTRHGGISRFYLYIDEVQNYTYWAGAMKTLYDRQPAIKCILTGSTSSLLRTEISTRLSGRYFACTIYPLSFSEFLDFRGVRRPTIIRQRQLFSEYLTYGGFPRVVLENEEALRIKVLENYYETIYLKDIIFPHNVRNNADIVDLLYFLISSVGDLHSYTRIAETLRIATDTVREYIGYAENAFLLYPVMKYDFSLRKQLANPKKVYCLDTGLANAVAFRFSENRGKLLENAVFIALKKAYGDVYYFKGRYECDFLVRSGTRITQAVQVTAMLGDAKTRKREIRGLCEAMEVHSLNDGVIVTESESGQEEIDGRTIRIVPVYEWLSRFSTLPQGEAASEKNHK